jgi:hypothetical protein
MRTHLVLAFVAPLVLAPPTGWAQSGKSETFVTVQPLHMDFGKLAQPSQRRTAQQSMN